MQSEFKFERYFDIYFYLFLQSELCIKYLMSFTPKPD